MASSTGASNTMAAISSMSSLSSASSLTGVSLSDVDIPSSTADMSPLPYPGPTHDIAIGLAIGIPMMGAVALIAALVYFKFYHGKSFPEKPLRGVPVVSISAYAPDDKKHDKPTDPVERAQHATPTTDTAIPAAELAVEYGAA